METLRVLVRLYKGYGLGDAVQMSPVLQHLRKYRPNWIVDYQAEEGKHQVGRGIAETTFAYGDPYPSNHYDIEVQIQLFDTWVNWQDRPNTRVSSTLRDRFGIDWVPECGRYVVNVSRDVWYQVRERMVAVEANRPHLHPLLPVVAVHYSGDSSPTRKNLSDTQADDICKEIKHLNGIPLLLDWRGTSPLIDIHTNVNRIGFPQGWGGNAEYNCAVISQCKAFIGIDSGPGKCASATDTPTLIVWTGHHPAPFHDPAPNTTHLVPEGYHGLFPVCDDPGVITWFEAHHRVMTYKDDPVAGIRKWLRETLQ